MRKYLTDIYENDRMLLIVITVFIIIQPFLDMRIFFENPSLQIFGLAIPTIVRCLGVFIIFVLSIKNIKKDKYHLFYAIYFLTLMMYTFFHHFVSNGAVNMPASYTYSLFNELFYIVRMILPFFIVYAMQNTKITYKHFITIILASSLIIGLIIILPNLFHISPPSYAIGGSLNKLNIIEWFTKGTTLYPFESYTSKGWFFMANQISGLMVLLLPLNYYDMIVKPNKLNISSSISLSLSMLILGTRVASFGLVGILFIMFLFGLLLFWKKQIVSKNILIYFFLMVCLSGVFLKAPFHNRVYSYGTVDNEITEEVDTSVKHSSNSKEQFVLSNYEHKKIQPIYIYKLYPYNYDTDFWINFIDASKGEVAQNRALQTNITTRISKQNPSIKYKLFGFSFSRFRNGHMYIENDFVVHFYTIGIFGILLLLGPWIFISFIGLKSLFKKYSMKQNVLTLTLLLSIAICLGASIFSGHVVDELIVTMYLGFVSGYLLNTVKGENQCIS